MNGIDNPREAQFQSRAERPADGLEDIAVRRYRLVYQALRSAPLAEPPPDFARQMDALTREQPELAAVAPELGTVTAFVVGIVAAVVAGPPVLAAWTALQPQLQGTPWPMLLAAGAALLAVSLIDLVANRRRARH